jgi:hypothetical protein
VGTVATITGLGILKAFTGTMPGSNTHSTRSTNHYNLDKRTHSSGSMTNSNSQSQHGGYQEIQQRAKDGWHTDLFGEPHFDSRCINDVVDGIFVTAGPSEAEARSVSGVNR